MATCACGCGKKTTIFRGKPRRYALGHAGSPPRRGLRETDYRIEDRGFDTACWIWQGALDRDGYATAKFANRRRRVQVVVYEQAHGEIPAVHDVHHRCGQRACLRLDHLELLPSAEHGRLQSRLTWDDVHEIRASTESQRALARRYQVGRGTIQRILSGEHWKEPV